MSTPSTELLEVATRAVVAAEHSMHTNESLGRQRNIARYVLAAIDKASEVTTEEQARELPEWSLYISDDGDLWERLPSGWAGIIKERGAEPWVTTGCEFPDLPGRVFRRGPK